MTIQEIFQALNLTMTGRNWADIAPGVTLHLHGPMGGEVIWVIVANYEAVAEGRIADGGDLVEALAAVVKKNRAHMIGFYACVQIVRTSDTAKFTREVWNRHRIAPAGGGCGYMDGVIHFSHVATFANRHLA